MSSPISPQSGGNTPKEIVSSFLASINEEDFAAAKACVTDDMKFEGVLGFRDGADAYFSDMEKMKLKYEIKKMIAEGNDVCVLYDIDMSGEKINTFGWYHVKHGKIGYIKVVFDPRPILEASEKTRH